MTFTKEQQEEFEWMFNEWSKINYPVGPSKYRAFESFHACYSIMIQRLEEKDKEIERLKIENINLNTRHAPDLNDDCIKIRDRIGNEIFSGSLIKLKNLQNDNSLLQKEIERLNTHIEELRRKLGYRSGWSSPPKDLELHTNSVVLNNYKLPPDRR